MAYQTLRARVCAANKEIARTGLAVLTWGNASEVDRDAGVMAIKPSGVSYDELTPDDIMVLSLASGSVVEGELRPSSDTPTHLHLYRVFDEVGGIVHTHSSYATAWAQAGASIPCYGTTHADAFYGEVPCTRGLTREEVEGEYELNTGKVIHEHFEQVGLSPAHMPAALVMNHGPFVWGASAASAVEYGVTLEEVAHMAWMSRMIRPDLPSAPAYLVDKHYLRKHGKDSYYGQN